MIPTAINGRWRLRLPAHRAERAEWDIANGGWEVARIASMAEHLGPGDILYDCGAEEGDMTALFGSFGAEVVAIEANPMVWPCLKATWEANVDRPLAGWYVGFVGADIAERPPHLDVNAQPVDGWPECAYGEMIPAHGFRHLYQQADATPTITLDALVERIGIPPTALTLDCEGSELAIMRGAGDVLAKHRPLVWISVHDEFMGYYGHSPADLHRHMAGFGYRSSHLATDHEAHWLYEPT